MLVIAVVVSISTKLTLSKLNQITGYQYYAAYSIVKSVTAEMLKDFDYDNEDYTTSFNFLDKFLFSKAYAASNKDCDFTTQTSGGYYCWHYQLIDPCDAMNFDCNKYVGQYNITQEMCDYPAQATAYGLYLNGGQCSDMDTYIYPDLEDTCLTVPSDKKGFVYIPSCTRYSFAFAVDFKWAGSTTWAHSTGASAHDTDMAFECNGGYVTYMVTNEFIEDEDEQDEQDEPEQEPASEPDLACNATPPDIIPCGKQWNDSPEVCALEDISPWPPTCGAGHEFNNSESVCGCTPIPKTIPRNGENFCKLFLSYSNTSATLISDGEECSGDSIDTDLTDFSNKKPDIVLRNGMRIYNVRQAPNVISELAGNTKGAIYIKNDETIDLDETGYTIYIDIDGSKGNSILWDDVYPFYVTLSGIVIPAYNKDNPETAGGDSKLHLQTSVRDEYIDNTGRHVEWVTKSRPFKYSACTMGYVTGRYCTTDPAVSSNIQCQISTHDCRLKTIIPVKVFY